MKKLIALAVLASSTAFATESAIYDIQYLPTPGTTYGFTTASMLDQKLEFDPSGEAEISGTILSQTIGHAFTDRLSLQAAISHADLEYDPDGGSKFDWAKGISDLDVTARFRTIDEKFRWDVIGGATISMSDREIKSDLDSNNSQGGHSLFVGTQFGSKQELFQWAILGQLTYNMEGTVDDKALDEKYDTESSNELLVRGDILNKLAEKSYLRSHISVNFTEEVELDDEGTDGLVDSFSAPSAVWELGTEYQHLFSRDLLARIGADYRMINQHTAVIEDNTAWVFTVGANYQF